MNERQQRFIDLLKQIFEIDKADLDFGIYRILNIRRNEIQDFFTNKLPQEITEILTPFATGGKEELRKKITELEAQCGGAEMIAQLPDTMPMKAQYNDLKAQLQQGTDLSALESDVYSALYSFFSRYYDEGDFISKRRYKEGVYAIPYEGEEVKLYWANQDQYYIKTAENFKDYTFKSDSYTVHFRLVDATTEQNNNKETDDKKRKFMLFTEDAENYPGIKTFETNEIRDKDGNVVEREYIVRFIYDVPEDQKAKWDEINYTTIRKNLSEQPDTQLQLELLRIVNPDAKKADQITLIQKHLKGYVAKNTFDYFIHKDLGGFLTRELDFFIKNEIMHLDDLDTANEARVNTYLAKVRAIKRVGKTIIAFLAQLENFQKKLWLKKKFVVETNWCVTLDRIDEKFYDEIRQNKAQVQEWIDMYAINEIESDLEHTEAWTDVPSITFLKQNQNLIVDTKHFSDEFKNKLIASIDNLDEETGGLMINSENFQALKFIQPRYHNAIKCTYIDPPYNAKSSEILYKNTFKHASWMSLMYDRIEEGKKLNADDFVYTIAIDEVEQENIGYILSDIYPSNKKVCLSIVHNPRGQQGKNISYIHEFAYMIYPNDQKKYLADIKRDEIDSRNLRDSGTESDRTDAATCFYPIIIKDNKVIGFGEVPSDDYHPESSNVVMEDGSIQVWPIDQNGNEKKWRYGRDSVSKIKNKLEPKYTSAYQIIFNQDMGVMKSLWTGAQYDASEYGTKVLQNILSVEGAKSFSYPKSINTVVECTRIAANNTKNIYCLDFFAGSGTTAHAIIKQNRDDKELHNKYILCEMGMYFNTVTLTRTKKVIYSERWSNGKPLSHSDGYSHIMKYLRLESYEDALSNVSLKAQPGMQSLFGEDYLINYMLDLEAKESLLNIKAFKTPFEYEMRITEKNECKEQRVDVCETFNYLIGLTVVRQGEIKYFSVKAAHNPEYEGAVDLVSDKNGSYAFRQIEGTLRDGRRALIIWRNISDNLLESNGALDAYFTKYRINPLDREYDVIYVNGDSNLENLRTDDESWKVVRTETEFNKRMFEEE